jgi:hypothetical protein
MTAFTESGKKAHMLKTFYPLLKGKQELIADEHAG